jgi:hypothetical protein
MDASRCDVVLNALEDFGFVSFSTLVVSVLLLTIMLKPMRHGDSYAE